MEKHTAHTPEVHTSEKEKRKEKITAFAGKTPNEAKAVLERHGKSIANLLTGAEGYNLKDYIKEKENAIDVFLAHPTAEMAAYVHKIIDTITALKINTSQESELWLTSKGWGQLPEYFSQIRDWIMAKGDEINKSVHKLLKEEREMTKALKGKDPMKAYTTLLEKFKIEEGHPFSAAIKKHVFETPIAESGNRKNINDIPEHTPKHSRELELFEDHY